MTDLLLAGEALNGRSGHEAGRQLLARLYREYTGRDCPEIRVTDLSDFTSSLNYQP